MPRGLLGRLTRPLGGYRLLRRLLAEARLIRRALERQADAQELSAGLVPRDTVHAQVFRSYAQAKSPLDAQDLKAATSVDYVDNRVLGAMLVREEELRAVLGRDPTEEEITRAYAGEIE